VYSLYAVNNVEAYCFVLRTEHYVRSIWCITRQTLEYVMSVLISSVCFVDGQAATVRV
jgi:hypothetical protein